MTVIVVIMCLQTGSIFSLLWWLHKEDVRFKRAYNYAVKRADPFSEKGQAYSDMATVLVLAAEEEVETRGVQSP